MSTITTAVAEFLCTDVARVVIAGLLLVGTLALLLTDRNVPEVLWALDGAAIGYYFGGAMRQVASG